MENKMSIAEVCEALKKSRTTLRRWRQGKGPNIPPIRYVCIGRDIWYFRPDVEAFLASPDGKLEHAQ